MIESTSPSTVQANATINEVIRSPHPPQPPTRSPNRPYTLASTSTNIKPPVSGALLNEEGLELSEQNYLWRAQGNYSKDERNKIKGRISTDETMSIKGDQIKKTIAKSQPQIILNHCFNLLRKEIRIDKEMTTTPGQIAHQLLAIDFTSSKR
ncbi:hypothetical protein O181_047406 [Austropuccinia psidii MF-1]|uniref:Uncharacterized protein n=1 Tax=Austropuccinia psidii MF-1 TaxID=1389203 RepID=A0A9Q3DNR6_9BASI|nr:hypothetical protein [Austropuccinia psidii MF-1]